jgi:hypothetical protein
MREKSYFHLNNSFIKLVVTIKYHVYNEKESHQIDMLAYCVILLSDDNSKE